MARSILWISVGLVCGALIGSLAPLALYVAANYYYGVAERQPLTIEGLLVMAIAGVVGAINGTIGALDGLRSNERRLWPVLLVPVILPAIPLVAFADAKTSGVLAFFAVIYSLFGYIAGRICQEIGVFGRRVMRSPEGAR